VAFAGISLPLIVANIRPFAAKPAIFSHGKTAEYAGIQKNNNYYNKKSKKALTFL